MGVGRGDAVLREQVAVLAERDEDDAVEEFLGDSDRGVEGLVVLAGEVVDQAQALELVRPVEIVADFLLSAFRQEEEVEGAGLLA